MVRRGRKVTLSVTAGDLAQAVAELKRLWLEEEGDSGGWTWNREEAQNERIAQRITQNNVANNAK
jgi:hypothetical protein